MQGYVMTQECMKQGRMIIHKYSEVTVINLYFQELQCPF